MDIQDLVFRQIELRKERVGANVAFTREHLHVFKDHDALSAQHIVRALMDIYVQDVEHITYEWPKDWWQAVKEHWGPEWFLRRYPVEYIRKGHRVMIQYPELAVGKYKHNVITIADRAEIFK